jgi:hypothetical protein
MSYIRSKKKRRGNWIGRILSRNCLVKRVIEGKPEGRVDVTFRRRRRRKQLVDVLNGKERLLEIERGSTRSHCVENWLWERLWTCRQGENITYCDGPEYLYYGFM